MRATRYKNENAPDIVRYVNYGGSIRAAQFIVLAAKARALSRRRYHVTYDDITLACHAGTAPSHPAELPRRIGSRGCGRDSRRLIEHMPPPKEA